jgi:O-antigen ligase
MIATAPPLRPADVHKAAPRAGSLAVGTTCLAVAFLPLLSPSGPGNSAPVDAFLVASIVAVALWTAARRIAIDLPYASAVSVLAIAAGVTGLFEGAIRAATLIIGRELLLFAWCAAITTLARDRSALTAIVRTWVLSATAWAMVVPVAFLTGQTAILGAKSGDGQRAALTFGNPNLAASYFALSLFLVIATRRPVRSGLRTVSLVVLFLALLLTGSNAGILGVVVGATFLAGRLLWERRGGAAATVAMLVPTLALALWASLGGPQALQQQAHRSASTLVRDSIGRSQQGANERNVLLDEETALLRTGPVLGRGPGSTKASLAAQGFGYVKEAHNDYLATLIERGLLGGIGLLLLIGGVVLRSGPLQLRRLDPRYASVIPVPAALLAALVVVAVIAFSHEVLHFRHVWALFGIVAGLHRYGLRNSPLATGRGA